MSTDAGGKSALSDRLAKNAGRAEFDAWAYVRDFDTTISTYGGRRGLYASERTQAAWNMWQHLDANWRDQRDIAIRLLRECEVTLAMWADVAPAVSLRADIRKCLGLGG